MKHVHRKLVLAVACIGLAILGTASARAAVFVPVFTEDFNSYAAGGLVAQSSPKWQFYPGWSADPAVGGGIGSLTTTIPNGGNATDVLGVAPTDIFAGTNSARLSYDINIDPGGSTGGDVQELIALGPGSYSGMNYAQTVTFFYVWTWPQGMGWFYNGPWGGVTTSLITPNTWHHIQIDIAKAGTALTWTFEIDGTPMGGPVYTTLTDSRGLNALELNSSNPRGDTHAWLDNIQAGFIDVPEPMSLSLLALGGLALLRRRK